MRRVAFALSVAAIFVACSSSSTPSNSVSSTSDAGSKSIDAGPPREPSSHRATDPTCAYTTAEPIQPITPGGPCTTNADCTAKPHGVCFNDITDGTFCYYDACTTDGDCASDEICACSSGDHVVANTCVKSSCHVDSDCGPAGYGYCSPSISCDELTGFFCHTATDSCVDDADCKPSGTCGSDGVSWSCSEEA